MCPLEGDNDPFIVTAKVCLLFPLPRLRGTGAGTEKEDGGLHPGLRICRSLVISQEHLKKEGGRG